MQSNNEHLKSLFKMELRNNKSAIATLATLGVTAAAAATTAILKIRKKRKERREEAEREAQGKGLSAEQMMVYNEAVRRFIDLNKRIYELRRHRQELQPFISRLAMDGDAPEKTKMEELNLLGDDIERFMTTQIPFINACLQSISDDMTYADCVHASVGGTFDSTLDEELTGADVAEGTPIAFVLKLGYCFPESTIAPDPVKSIVLV